MNRLLLLLAIWLVGCSAPSSPPTTAGSPRTRVAVVLPSAVDDLAWSQSMVNSLNALKQKDPNLEVAISDKMVSVADANAALRDYADEGYDLVVAHGTQYGNGLFEVAADFPEVSFAYGTATDTRGVRNVFAYDAAADQAGYVNGVLAAGLSQKGILGVVGPVEAGDAKLYIDGFQAGAQAARPDVKVLVAYTGSFSDTSQAAETASVQVQAGADVLTGSAQQVAGAINVAREKKLYWLGTQADQASLAPDQVVVCQTYDWTPVLQDILNERRQGRPGGKHYRLTFGKGLVSVFNPQVPVPEKVRASYDKALSEQK
ncbi:BMP family ABC transporter substrate-binding protein [bacterium CPR1]|nr:BMP family ABC transporter substrate-binding protein [bacterium CPR1]